VSEEKVEKRYQTMKEFEHKYDLIERLERDTEKIGGIRGTFTDAKTKCSSCTHSMIIRRCSTNRRIIICQMLEREMPEDILDCSKFDEIGKLTIAQLVNLATPVNDRQDREEGYL